MPLLAEIKKPFNLLSTAIAVVSLALSVYFYVASVQKREPVFLVQSHSQIFNSTVSSPKFRVVDSVGAPFNGDIHVLELSFWNSGRLAIEPADVRTPVVLRFPEGHRILDARVVSQTKPQVTQFTLSEPSTLNPTGPQVALGWAHLDPGLGARLQFIYVGKAQPAVLFEGDILDAEIQHAHSLFRRNTNEFTRVLFVVFVVVATWALASITIDRINTSSVWLGLLLLGARTVMVVSVAGFFLWLMFAPKSAPV